MMLFEPTFTNLEMLIYIFIRAIILMVLLFFIQKNSKINQKLPKSQYTMD